MSSPAVYFHNCAKDAVELCEALYVELLRERQRAERAERAERLLLQTTKAVSKRGRR